MYRNFYFGWYSDANKDGVPEELRYSTSTWFPNLNDDNCGRTAVINSLRSLSGDNLLIQLARVGKVDKRIFGRFELMWEIVDEDLLSYVNYDLATSTIVGVRLDHLWRQLWVSQNATGYVTVDKGYVLANNDMYFLLSDSTISIANSDTKVYATPDANGLLTIDSGTSVPTGSFLLTTMTVSSGVATLPALTGVANMRTCKIMSIDSSEKEGRTRDLKITLQEINNAA